MSTSRFGNIFDDPPASLLTPPVLTTPPRAALAEVSVNHVVAPKGFVGGKFGHLPRAAMSSPSVTIVEPRVRVRDAIYQAAFAPPAALPPAAVAVTAPPTPAPTAAKVGGVAFLMGGTPSDAAPRARRPPMHFSYTAPFAATTEGPLRVAPLLVPPQRPPSCATAPASAPPLAEEDRLRPASACASVALTLTSSSSSSSNTALLLFSPAIQNSRLTKAQAPLPRMRPRPTPSQPVCVPPRPAARGAASDTAATTLDAPLAARARVHIMKPLGGGGGTALLRVAVASTAAAAAAGVPKTRTAPRRQHVLLFRVARRAAASRSTNGKSTLIPLLAGGGVVPVVPVVPVPVPLPCYISLPSHRLPMPHFAPLRTKPKYSLRG